ncbi:afadin- and alpha-actinin-binding protein isoform X2 [Trichomycterus rosablanca]|uniref:afadin- and alpha-actinin-binding protein isoform X2 n=1 Tax=Trichomycterus rosablanca TaxID=2290929 RepID=UPI002F35C093
MASRREGRTPSCRRRAHNTSEAQRSRVLAPVSPPFSTTLHSASYRALREEPDDRATSLQEQLVERERHVSRLQDALRSEREKVARLQCRCNQQGAELKRREQHITRMREKLSQLYDRHRGDRGMSLEILNAPPKPSGRRDAASRSAKADARNEEALKLMLERREAELREAMKLRHSLTTLLHALRTDMQQTLQDVTECEEEGAEPSGLVQSERTLGDHVTGGVVLEWVHVQKRLRELLARSPAAVRTDQEKLLVQFEEELEQSRELIRLQQQLLQDSAASSLSDAPMDFYYLEEWERLQDQRAELNRQRRSFQQERRAFTDAAIRLGRERCVFEQQKASLMKQWFLSTSPLPESPQCNRRESTALSHLRMTAPDRLSLSPCVTPSSSEGSEVAPWSEQRTGVTPSTPELHCALQLNYCREAGSPAASGWATDERTDDFRTYRPAADSWPF